MDTSSFLRTAFITVLLFTVLAVQAQTVGTYYSNTNKRFESITWMTDGTIYSIDYFGGNIHKLKPDGSFSTISTNFTNLAGGGEGPDGNFYFSDINGGRVYRMTPDDSYTLFASGLNQPVGLVLSQDSTFFYVINYGDSSVKKIGLPGGSVSSFAIGGGINGPDGAALMDNGDLVVANYNDNKLHRISPTGNVSLFGQHPHFGNMGYIVKAGDYYYVPSIERHTIARFDAEGNGEIITGSTFQGYVDGTLDAARFTEPNGITVNATEDTLLVTEDNRIRFITGLSGTTSLPLALDDVDALRVYPQPFQEAVTLAYTSPRNAVTEVKIIDFSGKVCHQAILSESSQLGVNVTLQLPSLPPGAYLLQLWEEGKLRQVREIVRQ